MIGGSYAASMSQIFRRPLAAMALEKALVTGEKPCCLDDTRALLVFLRLVQPLLVDARSREPNFLRARRSRHRRQGGEEKGREIKKLIKLFN